MFNKNKVTILVEEGYVYFIYQKGDDARCKIGKSDKPVKRKTQLQTGNPDELYVYATLAGYTQLERELHTRFKEKRIRKSEWFYLLKEEVDAIIKEYTSDSKLSMHDQEFSTVEHLKKEENKTFICNKCEKEFKKEKHLKQHLKRKTPCDAKFICPKCGKEHPNEYTLESHLNRINSCVIEEVPVINATKNEHLCQYCNRTYSNAANLKRHQKTCDKETNMQHLMKMIIKVNRETNEKITQMQNQLAEHGIGSVTINNNNNNNVTVNNIQNN